MPTLGLIVNPVAGVGGRLGLHGSDDAPIYQSRVDVNGAQTRQVNLVSRSN